MCTCLINTITLIRGREEGREGGREREEERESKGREGEKGVR